MLDVLIDDLLGNCFIMPGRYYLYTFNEFL